MTKDSLRSYMVWIVFHLKTFEPEKRFMPEFFFQFVGVFLVFF